LLNGELIGYLSKFDRNSEFLSLALSFFKYLDEYSDKEKMILSKI
jgi:hypothetical protein